MPRDDEIAMLECKDGKWIIQWVQGQNYPSKSRRQFGIYDKDTALKVAADLDREHYSDDFGAVQHGITVHPYDDSYDDSHELIHQKKEQNSSRCLALVFFVFFSLFLAMYYHFVL
jgi:hypothetical protein